MKKFELVKQPGPKNFFEALAKDTQKKDALVIQCSGFEDLVLMPYSKLLELLETTNYNIIQKN